MFEIKIELDNTQYLHTFRQSCVDLIFTVIDYANVMYKIFWGLCNIGYPSETYPKPKSCDIAFVRNLLPSYQKIDILWSDTDVFYANDWTTETDMIDERNFVRYESSWNPPPSLNRQPSKPTRDILLN